MKLYVAIIPERRIIDKIIELRKKIVELDLADKDPRADVLPHLCVAYLNDEIDYGESLITDMKKKLTELEFPKKINLTAETYGDLITPGKIAAMFRPEDTKDMVEKVDTVLAKLGVSGNAKYESALNTPVGDHMKLARQIKEGKMEEVKAVFDTELPKEMIFNRVVLMGYGCQEKDILWQSG
jgi:2'-5' RNA ligase